MKSFFNISLFTIIFLLSISACKEKSGINVSDSPAGERSAESPRIVFLNIDTLLANYDLYLDRKAELEEQAKSAEKTLAGKIEAFQRRIGKFQQEVAEIQQKANTIAPIELKKLEEKYAQQQQNLGKEEESLMKQRENAAMELDKKLGETQKDLQDKIDVYLAKIADEKGFDMVLMKGAGGSVMFGKSSIDITKDVVKALNDEYKASKNLK
jgi:outer membrane protein